MNNPKIKKIKIDSQQYILIVLFDNGILKEIDFKEKLQDDFYSDLKNKMLFEQAQVDIGGYGVSWNEDIDISEYELWNIGKVISNESILF
ncbi:MULTISPECIES: DUF2442 domain-containing protein [Clostridium]|jgi:Protein of unknown function (DUF2442).|uniref:DUF2442 domain-containing protein n=1 Tax=Clostridium beijerinckii TaxID=1520 RepID=A0A1S9N8E8_CLOBE|nr:MULTISPECIES: DUF2442 domain-containing protein [Clostridium]MBN7573919.1 DUF2442 domain-containing protein [Clostridium beijerinckii]MBN7577599.1 DUF2442 domain-containing protein [Clostridium beijerinckii]MBN7583669.1 DUF2442 domain-containing protein [Clostridium beijerinckii]MBO0519909.1 DUF2442 domain-containing protein [Clostridium beijerinckii]OOP73827.1 hypothetical protein CBEIBR21_04830 [Clostridium beijerinckii]